MSKFMFRLEHLHVDFQRGKRPDVYASTFGIEVGSRAIGPIGRFLDKASPGARQGITSGADINFSDFPPDNPASRWGTWEIGPVEIGTGEIGAEQVSARERHVGQVGAGADEVPASRRPARWQRLRCPGVRA